MKTNSGRKQAQRNIQASKCEICGGTLILQRHHKNGNACDNSPENVEVLCQKCHTQVHVIIGNWGHGTVKPATCKICGELFRPKRTRRSTLCGNPECLKETGRRSAALRWV